MASKPQTPSGQQYSISPALMRLLIELEQSLQSSLLNSDYPEAQDFFRYKGYLLARSVITDAAYGHKTKDEIKEEFLGMTATNRYEIQTEGAQ